MRGLASAWPAARWAAFLAIALVAGCAQAPEPVTAADPTSHPAAEPGEAASQPVAAAAPAESGTSPNGAPALPTQPASETPQPPPSPRPAADGPAATPPTQPPSSSDAADDTAERRRGTLIVIDPGGEAEAEVDIVAAARAERERRATTPPAARKITNKNLVKAEDAGKTTLKPAAKPSPAPPAASAPAAEAGEKDSAAPDGGDERYWRNRSYELRERWKEAVDEIAELERDADGLRRRFYAEADPYVRDGRIKPDWDRVLDRIREMQEAAERRRQDLEAHLEQGRRAGALPGWLREGIELEPVARAEEQIEPEEAVEPPIYPDPIEPPGAAKDAAR